MPYIEDHYLSVTTAHQPGVMITANVRENRRGNQ